MKIIRMILSWLVTLLVPLALIFLGLRLVLTHTFLEVEYRLPGFPPDGYGFSLEDRLRWSEISWDYMLNDAGPSFLGDLTFPNGTALFTDREVSHMLDVKNVVQPALWVGYGAWAVLLGLGIWARWGNWWPEFKTGLRRGGWLTVGLVAVIGIGAAISFWQFFAIFHSLFFEGDSWLFLFSDTLIRIFPLRFWRDVFLFAGVIVLAGGLALGLGLRSRKKVS